MSDSIYEFSVKSLRGEDILLDRYKDKVVLIVNTASKCGFTSQYQGLQKLHEEFADQGLVILGFPCNQFGGQEPGTDSEIAGGCVLNYGVTFQMCAKIEVNGKEAHPLYKYLKSEVRGFLGAGIKWNFSKFLVNRGGKPVKRFSTTTKPEKLRKTIKALLK